MEATNMRILNSQAMKKNLRDENWEKKELCRDNPSVHKVSTLVYSTRARGWDTEM